MSSNSVLDIEQDIKAIVDSAHAQPTRPPVRFSEAASLGDNVRQGDIYLVLIPMPKATDLTAIPAAQLAAGYQLAPGNTQGSRHVLQFGRDSLGATVFTPKNQAAIADLVNKHAKLDKPVPAELIGPVFQPGSKDAVIVHPEHAHAVIPAATVPSDMACAVVYQRAFAEEVRRVQD